MTSEDRIKSFETWCHNNGLKFHPQLEIRSNKDSHLSVFYVSNENGQVDPENDSLKKKKSIEQISIEIPYKLLFSSIIQSNHPTVIELVSLLKQKDEGFFTKSFVAGDIEKSSVNTTPIEYSPSFILSLWFFIREYKNQSSFWRPYFDILPKHFDTVIYWNDEELNLIKNTNLYSECQQLKESLDFIFQYIHSIDPTVTKDDIFYSFTIFSSRSFPVQIKDENHTSVYSFKPIDPKAKPFDNVESCLVPYADIFNHSIDSTVTYISNCKDDTYSLVFECPSDYKEVELFNNYGCKDNQSLIRSYGFILKNNPYDSFYIQLRMDAYIRELEYRINMLKQLGIYQQRYEVFKHKIPSNLIQSMRIYSISEEESAFYRHDDPQLDINKPVSIRSEVRMYKILLNYLREKLNMIPSINTSPQGSVSPYRYDIANSYVTIQRNILTSTIQKLEEMLMKYLEEIKDKDNTLLQDFKDIYIENEEEIKEWLQKTESWRTYKGKKTIGVNVETMRIPQEFCLSYHSILESSFVKRLKESDESAFKYIDNVMLIILYILYSYYNEDQPHHSYIKSLEPFLQKSILLNDEEIYKIIEVGLGFELEEDLLNDIESIYQSFEDVAPYYEEIFDLDDYSESMFKFAYALILSSGDEIMNDFSEDRPLIILPFPRSYNEYSSYQIHYDKEDKSYRIISTGKLETEDSSFVLYDNFDYKNDLNTIIYHNYFNPNNPHHYIPVELYVDNDELCNLRFEVIERFMVTLLPKLKRGEIPYPIIYFGRIIAMTKEQLEDKTIEIRQMISEENEKIAFQRITQILNELIEKYKSVKPSDPPTLVDKMIKNNIEIIEHNIDEIRKVMKQ